MKFSQPLAFIFASILITTSANSATTYYRIQDHAGVTDLGWYVELFYEKDGDTGAIDMIAVDVVGTMMTGYRHWEMFTFPHASRWSLGDDNVVVDHLTNPPSMAVISRAEFDSLSPISAVLRQEALRKAPSYTEDPRKVRGAYVSLVDEAIHFVNENFKLSLDVSPLWDVFVREYHVIRAELISQGVILLKKEGTTPVTKGKKSATTWATLKKR
ncbi:MAG TPA: hypothetical protein VJB93_03925 [Patescibacteria group bacterium]|nr:hypothetical protein [Patescibacteria group bacterium]